MNIVLRKPGSEEYYIAYTQDSIRGGFRCGAKIVTLSEPPLVTHCTQYFFDKEGDAEKRCWVRVKMKMRKRGSVRVSTDDLPEELIPLMESPPGVSGDASELMAMVKEARAERYVVFRDVGGMEEFFDAGVEYLARELGSGFVSVYDRFGKSRGCFVDRMNYIVPTERAEEAGRIFNAV